MAGVKGFLPKFPGNLMRITTKTVTLGQAQVFDFKDGSSINTDLARLGRIGMVSCIFVRVRYSLTIPNGAPQTTFTTRRQRGCDYIATIEQPGVADAWWQGEQTLSYLAMASQVANLPATQLIRLFPGERGEVPPQLVRPTDRALVNCQQPDAAGESVWGFGDFAAPGVCENGSGAPVVQAVDDVFALAPVLASRNPRNDVIPLHYLTNDSNPVKIYVTVNDPTVSNMYPAGTTVGACTVELWAYISPNRADKDRPSIGLPYVVRNVPRNGPTIQFDPARSYRFVGLFPQFRGTTLDNGRRFFYEPYDYPTWTNNASKIKWQEIVAGEWRDTFPLLMSSGDNNVRRDVIDLYNELAAPGWEDGSPRDSLAPLVFPVDPSRLASTISDRIAGKLLFDDLGMGSMGFEQFQGLASFMPIIPYAVTGYIQEGFPGFGSPTGDCYPRILLDPDDRPTTNVTEIWANPKAIESIKALDGVMGRCECTGPGGAPQYKAALDNPASPAAAAVALMVPVTAPLKTEFVTAANMPKEAPPGVLQDLQNGKGDQKSK